MHTLIYRIFLIVLEEDHVHMVVVIPPRIAVADAIQFIKTQSAKKLKAKFPFMQKTYTKER